MTLEQLCPYDDCAWQLGIWRGDGWYRCPHCLRALYARETDSDVEDVHCYREQEEGLPPFDGNDTFYYAHNLGPSWASPSKLKVPFGHFEGEESRDYRWSIRETSNGQFAWWFYNAATNQEYSKWSTTLEEARTEVRDAMRDSGIR